MRPPSDHLLRVLAAVPVSSRILDLGCGSGAHTEALLRLGFDVDACDPRHDSVLAARERVMEATGSEEAAERIRAASLDELDDPDASFDWVIAHQPDGYLASPASLADLLATSHRLLKPGGWVYVAVPENGTFTPDALGTLAEDAELAEASAPESVEEHGTTLVRAIFRRVEPDTPV